MNPTSTETDETASPVGDDPRTLLARWANESDEWVRFLVSEVITSGRPLAEATIETAHQLFRQEKAIDARTLPPVEPLQVEARQDEAAPPLAITRLSGVEGVNALISGAVIEPHAGLTILYGENGTGKTGYSRIFKALANSRTADEILGDIELDDAVARAASVEYTLGDEAHVLSWAGESGVAPFTRMSIFDSPCVTTHVDDDLDYVYVPVALALFNHVIAGLQAVSARIESEISSLTPGTSTLLSRFPRESSVYPLIETLGASTDLAVLKTQASQDPQVDEALELLVETVAALKSNTTGVQLSARQRDSRALKQAVAVCAALASFDIAAYNKTLGERTQLAADYEAFRTQLFAAADLPAEPDETWGAFVRAGENYRQHLDEQGVHDADRCLYCRQTLTGPARDLLARYSSYLEDRISTDLRLADEALSVAHSTLASVATDQIAGFLGDHESADEKPQFLSSIQIVRDAHAALKETTQERGLLDGDSTSTLPAHQSTLAAAETVALSDVVTLEEQVQNRVAALAEKEKDLAELRAAAELARSWATIESTVNNAKLADRLRILKKPIASLSRAVTGLSKTASDQLINQSFDALFIEECEALRAPELKIQFVGREGKAHRRKVLSGKHKPSKVLSEGEQKVLAMADFLAEARLAGITAPVIFDDPVSSLDHRRINEVARRVANLAEDHQVIIFTHDIFFATTLLALFEKTKRCSYFQITDDDGKGKVTRATGPRWDTLSGIKGRINTTIQAARKEDGEAREALVRTGYDWIRSWCEVFTETELLRGVTQRYQPNVGMTKLGQINTEALSDIIPEVSRIFEEACRYIDGHSQPLPTLYTSPTLPELEKHWEELQQLRLKNEGKA